MRNKIPLMPLGMFILLCFLAAEACMADAPALLEQAQAAVNSGAYEQAEAIYRQVIADYPGTYYAFQAQKNLAIAYVHLGKDALVRSTYEQMVADFSDHAEIAAAVTHVADACRGCRKHTQACETYGYVITNWPADEHAMWSQMGLAISHACLGDGDAAETAIEELRTRYSGNTLLGRAICVVADNYRKFSRHEKAIEIYKCALANRPDPEFAVWSQMGLAISSIRLANYDTAGAAVEALRSNSSGDSRLSVAACLMADEYRRFGKHEEACELYQYVVDNWPDAEHALWSHVGLAISSLSRGDIEAADEAADKLLADFYTDDRSAVAECLLADEYRNSRRHEEARQLYRFVADRWPDTEHAFWSQMGLAISSIALGDERAAQDAVEKLVTEFSKDKNVPQAIRETVQQYRRQFQFENAEQVYQYASGILNNRPESEQTVWSRAAALVSDIALGKVGNVQAAIDDLIAESENDPGLPDAIFQIGQQYYHDAFLSENQGLDAEAGDRFTTAIAIWERLSDKLPELPQLAAQVHNFTAISYHRMCQHDQAIRHFRTVAYQYPDYEYADYAQFMVGRIYQQLKRLGQLSDSEAVPEMKLAYSNLVSRYPNSKATGPAQRVLQWIAQTESEKGEDK